MQKIISVALIIVGLLAGAYYAINYLPYTKQADTATPQKRTLEGTYGCLPLRDTHMTTSECAVGIVSDDGAYYAIDFGFYAQGMPQLVEGDRLTAVGIITPIETLSTDYWQKYPVVGIFSVTDSLVIEEKVETPSVASTSLAGTSWVWQKTVLHDGSIIEATEGKFVLTFTPERTYQSTTDCNSLSGTYTAESQALSLAVPAMTKMFCEGSIENEYVSQLALIRSYVIEGDTLQLHLSPEYGVMEFKVQ